MNAPALPKRYSVASLLGEGGQGRVYRVRDSLRDRDLALKLVSADDAEFLRREFDTLRQIRHENLIQVFDWGTLDSREAFYTMELVEGEDWGHRMGTAQPADEVRRILTGLLRGLAHLHCHGEIHGDLKPGNILLGQGGVVKVTDVGMAGSVKGGIAGTPGYTAPECWEGKPADIRADLYSVGVMAYEALTGKHPFGGRTIREVVAGQIEGWVPSPGAHRVKVPADLERVVMRALEREPTLRQGSADEYMEGFGVEDRVGAILGGKFVDPKNLVSALVARVERKSADPTLVNVVGAPGVGKSEFVDQCGHALVERGVRCVRLALDRRRSFLETLASELNLDPGWSGEILASVTKQIVALAGASPIVILLDDEIPSVETDGSSVRNLAQRLFAESVERDEAVRALIVATRASEGASEVFASSVRVDDLDEDGVTAMIRGYLGDIELGRTASHALYEVTGGNPQSLQTLISDLMEGGALERLAGKWKLTQVGRIAAGSGSALGDRWLARWRDLGPELQGLLVCLALLEFVADEDRASLEAAAKCPGGIAGLAARGWLKEVSHQHRFVSEGLRINLLHRLDDTKKRPLAVSLVRHGLATRGAQPLALNLLAEPTASSVLAVLRQASDAVNTQDHTLARTLLAQCGRHADLLGLRDKASLYLALAEVSLSSGELDDAARYCTDESVVEASETDKSMHARVHWILGTIAGRAGEMKKAEAELVAATTSAKAARDNALVFRSIASRAEFAWTHGNDDERASVIEVARSALRDLSHVTDGREERGRLVYALGASLIRTTKFEDAVALLGDELASVDSTYWRARAANALGTAQFYLGRYDQALDALASGLGMLTDGDAPEVRARIHANRGACLNAMGRLREALHDNENALVLSRRAGSGYDIVAAAAGIALDLYYLGRYDGAIARARDVVVLAERIDNVVYEFKGLEIEGFAALALGDLDAVGRVLEAAGHLPADHDPVRTLPRIELLRARLEMVRGDGPKAAESLGRAMDLLQDENDLEDLWGVQIELAVLNHIKADASATIRTLGAIAEKARCAKNIVVEVNAMAAIADVLASGVGRHLDTLQLLTQALGRAEESGFVIQAARISVGLGVALIDQGDTRAGRSRLVQAQRLLQQIASELSPASRQSFVRSPHVAPALAQIMQRLAPLPS